MKNFLIGIMCGLVLSGGVAWAATRCSLQDGIGREVGTTSNPLIVEII